MKPYKIIKTKGIKPKKTKVLVPLNNPKIPFTFFKKVFTPPKGEVYLND